MTKDTKYVYVVMIEFSDNVESIWGIYENEEYANRVRDDLTKTDKYNYYTVDRHVVHSNVY